MRLSVFIALLAVMGAVSILVFQPLVESTQNFTLALVLMTLVFWATNIIPAYLTSLLFFVLCMLGGVAPLSVTFAGFASSALWMIFAGLVLGCAIEYTGLAQRMAQFLALKFTHISYTYIIISIMIWGMVLSFVMPSALGRVVLCIPIVVALAKQLGFTPGTRGYTGMLLATGCGVFFPAFGILPSNVPNMVWMGAIENLFPQAVPTYTSYLLLHFPILGILKGIVLSVIIVVLYHDCPKPLQTAPRLPSMTSSEYTLTLLLFGGLSLWATDFLHHISPAWIGLSMAIICLFPRSALLPVQALSAHIDLQPFLYVAGVISLGVVASYTGLGRVAVDVILADLPLRESQPIFNFFLLVLLSLIVALLTTLPGIPAVFTPLSMDLATASGFTLETVLMLQVLGFSTVILPYQSPPLMVALQQGKISLYEGTKVCLILTSITLLVLFPLDYFWWKVLGRI